MITFSEALNIVRHNRIKIGSERVPLSAAMGRFMAESVYADRDTPPFNKSAVDGFACKEEDLTNKLEIVETIPAGYEPSFKVERGQCSRIMTGAMLPAGADTVVMVEDCVVEDNYMLYRGGKGRDNICVKGEDMPEGSVAIPKGTFTGAAHIAILASMGVSYPLVFKKIRLGILSTGDEIIEPDAIPSTVQIRNSNGWQLYAQALSAGAEASYLGIAKDEKDDVKKSISDGLKTNDALIITGGVSMGDFDYVPETLESLGFTILFNKVAVQPGKPSTFAVLRDDNGDVKKVIFALPGNPVSCYLQFQLLVKEWLCSSSESSAQGIWTKLPIAREFKRKNTSRLAFVPGKITTNGEFETLSYNGSAHILAMGDATTVASIPVGKGKFSKGEAITVFILER